MAFLYFLSLSCFFIFRTYSAAVLQQPLGTHGLEDSISTAASFDDLLGKLQSPLLNVTPVGSPCYTKPGPLNEALCKVVRQKRESDTWVTDQPGGYFWPNWAACQNKAQTCALPEKLSAIIPPNAVCHQGGVPARTFKLQDSLRDIEDVRTIFKSAQLTNTPVIIKNTGHDWRGRSSGSAPLAIWTHHYKSPNVPIKLDTSFVPVGCSSCKAETVLHLGGGETWRGVYAFAAKHNLTVVGGTCGTVGVAGWLASGGHSPLTPTWGMGVDNVRQIKVVTPKGDVMVANEHFNKDIFFAIRGGGGGTFGLITDITYQAYPKYKIHNFYVKFTNTTKADRTAVTRDFFSILTKNAANWAEKGWGGYIRPGEYMDLVKNASVPVSEAEDDMAELSLYLENLGFKPNVTTRSSWIAYYGTNHNRTDQHHAGGGLAIGSRLLPSELFNQASSNDTATTLYSMYDSGFQKNISTMILLVAPTVYAKTHRDTSSLHPSWRTAIWSIRFSKYWNEYSNGNNRTFIRSQFALVHKATEALRELAPESGISISEADVWERNHTVGFWGERYERLARIKREMDPGNVLVNWQGIGWDRDRAVAEERFACYPPPSWF